MSRPSRSVYTVTRSTYLPADDQMSDIAFIDVDDDDSYGDTNLYSSFSSAKPVPAGSLCEAKQQISATHRELQERGVFDYVITNRVPEPTAVPHNHLYLGPGGSSSQRSSGARKFIDAHRQADRASGSDEEVRATICESRWSPSSHKHGIYDSPSLDSQWVKHQYNQHVRQANTQGYDEAELCNDSDSYLTDNRHLSPATTTETNPIDFLSSCSTTADNEPVLYRRLRSDTSRDICDSYKCLNSGRDYDSYRDTSIACGDSSDVNCGTKQRSRLPVTQSFPLRSASRNSEDFCETGSNHMSSSGHSWPVSARSCDTYGGHTAASHQNAIYRSSELSTVVSAVGSVRCSTGVDTGVGFPLSTISSRSSQGHTDVSRLSSSGQTSVSSGLDGVHRTAGNGVQPFAGYHKSYDGSGTHSFIGRSANYDHVTFRKDRQDNDNSSYLYGCRGNDSDGDDGISDIRRSDADFTSNADILQRSDRAKVYETTSSTTVRPYMSSPQYHLIPTEEDDAEHKQSAKGQQLERMQRRRKARLNRQSAGFLKADSIPGFRGEASLEELISYIDAPASATGDVKTGRKSKKKKKKVAPVSSFDANAQQLANSCEVFVGTEGVSSDEPCIRVGDSCCIELRKKSDCEVAPDAVNTAVEYTDITAEVSSVKTWEGDRHAVASSIVTDDTIVDSLYELTDSDAAGVRAELFEDLPEVAYAEVKNAMFEELNSETLSKSDETSVTDTQSHLVCCDTPTYLVEDSYDGSVRTTDVDQMSTESGETTTMTESICSLSVENSGEYSESPATAVTENHDPSWLIGLDSATDNRNMEDVFVTVQKKKRTKNVSSAAAVEDPRCRFGRRASAKGVDDRDISHCMKRYWVKSCDSISAMPSVAVSRSSIIYSKPSCSATQKCDLLRFCPTSSPDLQSSSVYDKCWDKSASSAISVESDGESVATHDSKHEPSLEDFSCTSSSYRNVSDSLCDSDEVAQSENQNTIVMSVGNVQPTDTVLTAEQHAFCSQQLEVCDSDNKFSDVPVTAVLDISCAEVVKLASVSNDKHSTVNTDILMDGVDGRSDVSCVAAEDLLADDKAKGAKMLSCQSSVPHTVGSEVFLDTRNIAGTTPPRSDISFGFDPSNSPELCDHVLTVSQPFSHPSATSNAAVGSSLCPPVIAPMPPPVHGCVPVLYFYPAIPMTILPPVAPFNAGRCTPVGVVPPMPAVADPSIVSVAPCALHQEQNVNYDGVVISDVMVPSTAAKAVNCFDLFSAQRFLYAEFQKVLETLESNATCLPYECLVIHYSSLDTSQDL